MEHNPADDGKNKNTTSWVNGDGPYCQTFDCVPREPIQTTNATSSGSLSLVFLMIRQILFAF